MRCSPILAPGCRTVSPLGPAREFLLRLIAAIPYKVHNVFTDNRIQFTTPDAGGSAVPLIKEAIANSERF